MNCKLKATICTSFGMIGYDFAVYEIAALDVNCVAKGVKGVATEGMKNE